MLFKRRESLKKQYDIKLLSQIEELKLQWQDEKNIWEKSIDTSEDLDTQVKLAELKYFYLFKEAKVRDIRVSSLLK
ncbi:YaaL family protein [Caldibacillus lycopersici]|uniref:YaaL family protein n=1 Tax=Perspicuibacillus lycopersici TaxID=1325689 RepID=A0AAE3J0E5_9BACI|nr:YaaL family protein [Perspicuibacillus lycopersici]MCU9615360.1 YaaL family protein [Perspicuibacillus lycopersici]